MSAIHSRLDGSLAWAALCFVVLSASIEAVLFAVRDAPLQSETEVLSSLLFNTAWSWWVFVDRRQNGIGFPYGFDALVFFAWPLVAPYYLIKSRKLRAGSDASMIWFLYSLPYVVAGLCYILF
ncbi:hypothetical protein BH11PSE11_BH11PSE11_21770 [soil metagenome]